MMNWLRKAIKGWLERADGPPAALDCLIDGKIKRMAVGPAVGFMLQVHDGDSVVLISKEQAVDKGAFAAAWVYQTRGTFTWEDGTPAKPEELL